MDKSVDGYRLGQIVISKRGKDAGRAYVIAGFPGGCRLALIDWKRFTVSRPKFKNPRHVQATLRFIEADMIASIEAGKDVNPGELRRFLDTPKARALVK